MGHIPLRCDTLSFKFRKLTLIFLSSAFYCGAQQVYALVSLLNMYVGGKFIVNALMSLVLNIKFIMF